MRIGFKAENFEDAGRPAGGYVAGTGFTIAWQNGPVGRVGTDERTSPTGAFVEDVIAACRQRIQHYQEVCGGRFACVENSEAIQCLNAALSYLDDRTKRRTEDGTEGTHEGS